MDGASGIDDEEGPLTPTVRMAIHPVCAGDCAIRLKVRQQGKLKLAVAGKGEMTPGAVNWNPEHGGVEMPKLGRSSLYSVTWSPHGAIQSAG